MSFLVLENLIGSYGFLWRGDLSPLGCEAAPKQSSAVYLEDCGYPIGAASQPSGDKSPRHKKPALFLKKRDRWKNRYVNATRKCRVSDTSPLNSAFVAQIR
ncbi:hypothetical protein EGM97_24905 [Pseudomonas sp. AF32]|nr:hypothetical protein [Pseudomonas sp. AF32]